MIYIIKLHKKNDGEFNRVVSIVSLTDSPHSNLPGHGRAVYITFEALWDFASRICQGAYSIQQLTTPPPLPVTCTYTSSSLLLPNLYLLFIMMYCSSHYSSSFGLISLTKRVDEGQPPASAGGMPETTLSTSDLIMI